MDDESDLDSCHVELMRIVMGAEQSIRSADTPRWDALHPLTPEDAADRIRTAGRARRLAQEFAAAWAEVCTPPIRPRLHRRIPLMKTRFELMNID